MLHLILLALFFSTRSHHSFWAMDSEWVGGTQLDTVSTVWAATGCAAKAAAAAAKKRDRFMAQGSLDGLPSTVRLAVDGPGPDLPEFADRLVGELSAARQSFSWRPLNAGEP